MRRGAHEDVSGADGGEMMAEPKEYYISCYQSPYDGMEITAEQYSILETASIELKKLLFEIDYYPIVMKNVQGFIRFCEGEQLERKDSTDFITLNRLFANWINSFYMWIEYHQNHYNELFVLMKSSFFDSYFSYRFASNLRTYTTHRAMPITERIIDVITGTTRFLIDSKPMWKKSTSGVQGIFARELSQKGIESIDAYQMAIDFVPMFQAIQKDLWNELQTPLCETLMSVHDIVPITDSCFCNAYVQRESDHASLPIGHQMKYLADKSRETGYDFYSSFSSKFAE